MEQQPLFFSFLFLLPLPLISSSAFFSCFKTLKRNETAPSSRYVFPFACGRWALRWPTRHQLWKYAFLEADFGCGLDDRLCSLA